MPSLEELQLSPDAVPEGDWDAPESGSFPPHLTPGTYEFIFHMPDDPSQAFELGQAKDASGNPAGAPYLVILYEVEAVAKGDGTPLQPNEATGEYPRLRFQRASFYKSEKMPISFGQDLLRALGLRVSPFTPTAIKEALYGASGRVRFRGEVGWRAYFKGSQVTVSTRPRRKKGELPWPKAADGAYELMAVDPSGEKAYGREEVIRFKLPGKE